jgi:hypothetical protein
MSKILLTSATASFVEVLVAVITTIDFYSSWIIVVNWCSDSKAIGTIVIVVIDIIVIWYRRSNIVCILGGEFIVVGVGVGVGVDVAVEVIRS